MVVSADKVERQYIHFYVFETFRTTLHAAAFGDHAECLQLLLRHDAQVNAVDNSGKTALMMAAENGQAGAVGMYPAVDFVPIY